MTYLRLWILEIWIQAWAYSTEFIYNTFSTEIYLQRGYWAPGATKYAMIYYVHTRSFFKIYSVAENPMVPLRWGHSLSPRLRSCETFVRMDAKQSARIRMDSLFPTQKIIRVASKDCFEDPNVLTICDIFRDFGNRQWLVVIHSVIPKHVAHRSQLSIHVFFQTVPWEWKRKVGF